MNIPAIHEALLPLKGGKKGTPVQSSTKSSSVHRKYRERNILNNIVGMKTAKPRFLETLLDKPPNLFNK